MDTAMLTATRGMSTANMGTDTTATRPATTGMSTAQRDTTKTMATNVGSAVWQP
jgi:hypothetical protein